MQFRYARHTNNLDPLIRFYTDIIGLEKLGEFKDHDGYQGVFIGPGNADWHLEFTASLELAHHSFDEDDLIVFYMNTGAEIKALIKNARKNNIFEVAARNAYWNENGHIFIDPDGCRVVISLRSPQLLAQDSLTRTLAERGIKDWNEAVKFIQQLPYGRNSDRGDFSLVIKENKGTCSSKHALLKNNR